MKKKNKRETGFDHLRVGFYQNWILFWFKWLKNIWLTINQQNHGLSAINFQTIELVINKFTSFNSWNFFCNFKFGEI